jgi:hypothetical protein
MDHKLKALLENSQAVKIVFKKRDGSERTMFATLSEELIGVKTYSRNTASNEVAQSVWDLEKDAWRSFRWDSVISYEEVQNG